MSRFKTHGVRNDHPYAMLHKGQSRRVTTIPISGGLQVSVMVGKDAPPYEELINFPRAKGKDEIRCVMCGSTPGFPGCVIPRQNKDVCKECDKSTWQHMASSIFFKWCKGCKKFLRLGSFSEKLDAAKCDRCRERGRQSYLLKKCKDPLPEARFRSQSESFPPMDRMHHASPQNKAHDINGVNLAAVATMAKLGGTAMVRPRQEAHIQETGRTDASHVSLSSGDDDYRDQSDSKYSNSEDEYYDGGEFRHPEMRNHYQTCGRTRAYSEGCKTTCKRPNTRLFCSEDGKTAVSAETKTENKDNDSHIIGKLSGAFGMPLHTVISPKGGVQSRPTGHLLEVASIHQRIMFLEECASRVVKLEQVALVRETLTESLQRDRKRLIEEVAASRNKERVLLEEADQLRAEVVSLRERRSCSRCGQYSQSEAWNTLEKTRQPAARKQTPISQTQRTTRSSSFSSLQKG